MSLFFNLRDWARGQRILTSDLQGHTDRLNTVYPLSFWGNVRVRQSLKHGTAVYVPRSAQGVASSLRVVKIVSEVSGVSGTYNGKVVGRPDSLNTAADLDAASQLGELGDDDIRILNLQEIDQSPDSHWLTHADNTLQKYFLGLHWGSDEDSGKTVYVIVGIWVDPCEGGDGEPGPEGPAGPPGDSITVTEGAAPPGGGDNGDVFILTS